MEDNLKNLIWGGVLISLFAILIWSFAFNLANSYGKDTTGLPTNAVDFSALNQSVSQMNSEAENLRTSFEQQGIFSTFVGLLGTGIFTFAKSIFSFAFGMYSLIFTGLLTNVLKVPPIVTGVVIGLVILSALFGIWRLLRAGD